MVGIDDDLHRARRTIDRLTPQLEADARALETSGRSDPAAAELARDYRQLLEQICRLADDVKTAGAQSSATEERS
ncbi:MAG TPA: hypothetical protein PKB10_08585 [Tepidisphaeraceae bacterium]|nr:hypothetical protein [Tepidisphaeraceae bacterium]